MNGMVMGTVKTKEERQNDTTMTSPPSSCRVAPQGTVQGRVVWRDPARRRRLTRVGMDGPTRQMPAAPPANHPGP